MKILIVDDEPQISKLMSRILALEGYEVVTAEDLKSGLRQAGLFHPDVVLCDVFLPDGSGVEAVAALKTQSPFCEVVMFTAHGNIADGVRAIKNGAFDYLTKGDDNNRIVPMIANAMEKVSLKKRLANLESLLKRDYTFDSICGKSKQIRRSIDLAQKVSPTDAVVLLTGETGTGKEVFANAIHMGSSRKKESFVAVNCAALSNDLLESELFGYKAGAFTGALKDKKGLFEQADKGTIFLDEIGEMPLLLQSKLLRVLETGEFIPVGDTRATKVNVRIIAATNRDLEKCVSEGLFREDLYYRLSVFMIGLPPLRERKEDIADLARSFIDAFSAKMNRSITDIEPAFFDALRSYVWKGNIRELRNCMERSVILSSDNVIRLSDLPVDMQMCTVVSGNEMELATVERKHIMKVLAYTGGNKTEASRLMKIGLTTLYRKLEEYGINN